MVEFGYDQLTSQILRCSEHAIGITMQSGARHAWMQQEIMEVHPLPKPNRTSSRDYSYMHGFQSHPLIEGCECQAGAPYSGGALRAMEGWPWGVDG
jgi:hypothetical protein